MKSNRLCTEVVMFRPYAYIREHNLIEKSFIDSARANNISVSLIECNRDLMPFCFNMYTHGLDFETRQDKRNSFCNECKYQAGINRIYSDYKTISLSQILPELDSETLHKLDYTFNSKSPKFLHEDLDFCQIASYEIRIRNASHTEIARHLYTEWRRQTELCIRIFLGAQQYFRQKEPSMAVAYNRLYSLNNSFLSAAESMGHISVGLHAHGRPSKIYDRITVSFHRNHPLHPVDQNSWEIVQSKPLTIFQILRTFLVLKDYLYSNGGWAFSNSISATGKRKIENLAKSYFGGLVVLTLSSSDEMFAAHSAGVQIPWKNHMGFLQAQLSAIKKFVSLARENPNTLFIIRPHPRDCGNKRGARSVEGFSESLRFLLSDVPDSLSNLYLNTPEDGISIYDLINVAKFVFNVNSTAGVHNTALGGTTIDLSERTLISYPKPINRLIESFDSSELTEPKKKAEFQKIIFSWRWIYFQHYGNSIDANTNVLNKWSFRQARIPFKYLQNVSRKKQSVFRIHFWILLLLYRKQTKTRSGVLFRRTEELFLTNIESKNSNQRKFEPTRISINGVLEKFFISIALLKMRSKK